jgi:hypothetical protein
MGRCCYRVRVAAEAAPKTERRHHAQETLEPTEPALLTNFRLRPTMHPTQT